MLTIDPGHYYGLKNLDVVRDEHQTVRFVKRVGEKYPGNTFAYPGTTIQEVLRMCISRLQYVDRQIPHSVNSACIEHLRTVINLLERRAAERHGAQQPRWEVTPELVPVEENGHWKFKEKDNAQEKSV